jgi:hypothetical protein
MTLKDNALRAAILKAVADGLAAELDAGRSELFAELTDLYDVTGSKSLDVKLLDGAKVASISLSMPKAGPVITDPIAFDEFVREHYPHGIVKVPAREEVSPAFRDELLKRLTYTPEGVAITEDGEIVAGLEHKPAGAPKSFSIRFEKGGREQIAMAWSDGLLGALMPGIAPLALTDGGTDE